eukprot:15365923-Ditylum_brightwellii.AAC.1
MKLKSRYQYDGTVSVLKCTSNLKKKGIRLANRKKTNVGTGKKVAHKVIGEGYMNIPNGDGTYSNVYSWHTPTMPTTVISPGEVEHHHKKLYKSNIIYCDEDAQTGYVKFHIRVSSCDIVMNTQYINKKTFMLPLVPTNSSSNVNSVQDEINYMTEDGLQTIWHQHLCHTHNVSNLHHYVDGIPKIKNPTDIDKCDTCLTCKMRKCAKGYGDMRKDAVMVGKGLSLDWGFMVQKSKNQERTQKLTSIDGSQSYLLVVDRYSD